MNDANIEAQIERLRTLMDAEPKHRSVDDVQEVLRDLGRLSRKILMDFGEAPRSGRQVGIEDEIPPELFERVAQQRWTRQMEIPDLVVPLEPSQRRQTRMMSLFGG